MPPRVESSARQSDRRPETSDVEPSRGTAPLSAPNHGASSYSADPPLSLASGRIVYRGGEPVRHPVLAPMAVRAPKIEGLTQTQKAVIDALREGLEKYLLDNDFLTSDEIEAREALSFDTVDMTIYAGIGDRVKKVRITSPTIRALYNNKMLRDTSEFKFLAMALITYARTMDHRVLEKKIINAMNGEYGSRLTWDDRVEALESVTVPDLTDLADISEAEDKRVKEAWDSGAAVYLCGYSRGTIDRYGMITDFLVMRTERPEGNIPWVLVRRVQDRIIFIESGSGLGKALEENLLGNPIVKKGAREAPSARPRAASTPSDRRVAPRPGTTPHPAAPLGQLRATETPDDRRAAWRLNAAKVKPGSTQARIISILSEAVYFFLSTKRISVAQGGKLVRKDGSRVDSYTLSIDTGSAAATDPEGEELEALVKERRERRTREEVLAEADAARAMKADEQAEDGAVTRKTYTITADTLGMLLVGAFEEDHLIPLALALVDFFERYFRPVALDIIDAMNAHYGHRLSWDKRAKALRQVLFEPNPGDPIAKAFQRGRPLYLIPREGTRLGRDGFLTGDVHLTVKRPVKGTASVELARKTSTIHIVKAEGPAGEEFALNLIESGAASAYGELQKGLRLRVEGRTRESVEPPPNLEPLLAYLQCRGTLTYQFFFIGFQTAMINILKDLGLNGQARQAFCDAMDSLKTRNAAALWVSWRQKFSSSTYQGLYSSTYLKAHVKTIPQPSSVIHPEALDDILFKIIEALHMEGLLKFGMAVNAEPEEFVRILKDDYKYGEPDEAEDAVAQDQDAIIWQLVQWLRSDDLSPRIWLSKLDSAFWKKTSSLRPEEEATKPYENYGASDATTDEEPGEIDRDKAAQQETEQRQREQEARQLLKEGLATIGPPPKGQRLKFKIHTGVKVVESHVTRETIAALDGDQFHKPAFVLLAQGLTEHFSHRNHRMEGRIVTAMNALFGSRLNWDNRFSSFQDVPLNQIRGWDEVMRATLERGEPIYLGTISAAALGADGFFKGSFRLYDELPEQGIGNIELRKLNGAVRAVDHRGWNAGDLRRYLVSIGWVSDSFLYHFSRIPSFSKLIEQGRRSPDLLRKAATEAFDGDIPRSFYLVGHHQATFARVYKFSGSPTFERRAPDNMNLPYVQIQSIGTRLVVRDYGKHQSIRFARALIASGMAGSSANFEIREARGPLDLVKAASKRPRLLYEAAREQNDGKPVAKFYVHCSQFDTLDFHSTLKGHLIVQLHEPAVDCPYVEIDVANRSERMAGVSSEKAMALVTLLEETGLAKDHIGRDAIPQRVEIRSFAPRSNARHGRRRRDRWPGLSVDRVAGTSRTNARGVVYQTSSPSPTSVLTYRGPRNIVGLRPGVEVTRSHGPRMPPLPLPHLDPPSATQQADRLTKGRKDPDRRTITHSHAERLSASILEDGNELPQSTHEADGIDREKRRRHRSTRLALRRALALRSSTQALRRLTTRVL